MPRVDPPPGQVDDEAGQRFEHLRSLTNAAATADPKHAEAAHEHHQAKADEHRQRMIKQPYEYRRQADEREDFKGDDYSVYKGEEKVGQMLVSHMEAHLPTTIYPEKGEMHESWLQDFYNPDTDDMERGVRTAVSKIDPRDYEDTDPHPRLFMQVGAKPARSVVDNMVVARGHQAVGMTMVGMAMDRAQRHFGNQLMPDDDLSAHSMRLVGNPAVAATIPKDWEQRKTNQMQFLGERVSEQGDIVDEPSIRYEPPSQRFDPVAAPEEVRRGKDMLRSIVKRSRDERLAQTPRNDPAQGTLF